MNRFKSSSINPIIACLEEALLSGDTTADRALRLYNEGKFIVAFDADKLGSRIEYSFPDHDTVRFTIFQ